MAEEICTDDRHGHVCYQEFPRVSLTVVGYGHLFEAVSVYLGAVGCLKSVARSSVGTLEFGSR